jgi:hypothetical protein
MPQNSDANSVGRLALRGVFDATAATLGFVLGGGPAGALAAGEFADQLYQGGEGILDALTGGHESTQYGVLANQAVSLTAHQNAQRPITHTGQTNNVAQMLPIRMGSQNQFVSGRDIIEEVRPVTRIQPQIDTSVGAWGHRFMYPTEPIDEMGIAGKKRDGALTEPLEGVQRKIVYQYENRKFVSDQNQNPNPGMATTGFTKLRDPRKINEDKQKFYSVLI